MLSRLTAKLAHLFPSSVKSRGRGYHERGAVRINTGSTDLVDAEVQGGELYRTRLEWEDGNVTLSCSCPYFESGGACKHLWATVLAAQARGYLSIVDSDSSSEYADEADPERETGDTASVLASLTPAALLKPAGPKPPQWKLQIERLARNQPVDPFVRDFPARRQILYVIDIAASIAAGHVVLYLCSRDRKANGTLGRIAPLNLQRSQIPALPVAEDRDILATVAGGIQHLSAGYLDGRYAQLPGSNGIQHPLAATLIPQIIQTGRCFLRSNYSSQDTTPLAWDDAGPWHFELEVRTQAATKSGAGLPLLLAGVLRRGETTQDVSLPALITPGGHVFTSDGTHALAAPILSTAGFEWLMHMRRTGAIQVPPDDASDLLSTLLSAPGLPKLTVPKHLKFEEVTVEPKPSLRIRAVDSRQFDSRLTAELSFDYGGHRIAALAKSSGFYDAANRRFVRRNLNAEAAASNLLTDIGVKFNEASRHGQPYWDLASVRLPGVARALMEAGWDVDADGKVFRPAGAYQMEVSTGVDWFELHGTVQYGETSAKLPELLEALRRGDSMVRLKDGTYGMLPEEWLSRVGMVAGMGTSKDGHIRFRSSQAGLLDALLSTQPEARFDKKFAHVRAELHAFEGVDTATQPEGFTGQLRDYQLEGLGWMNFLQRFGFGGCLADDMGVGKTAQVLALLEQRRQLRSATKPNGKKPTPGPSLVVVPRSLIFNWKQEAEKFTPQLRILDYTGLNRDSTSLSAYDLVITTYGTLRRDAIRLREVEFDYIVLDEAQAVKNANTESAKAVRLLQGENRLTLSGTPIENHLGELWSMFDFLNPGMLGTANVFKLTTGADTQGNEASRRVLAQALRPFILRRTKQQVARELPAKTEQTIYCELEPEQRKLYDELRDYYRDAVLNRIDTQGMGKSKIMVLEALLRLRQAACHPGLIDAERAGESSAKLEALLERLAEVLDSGQKVLVFSQFTSLLSLVRTRLDEGGIVYEYLDGKTRDRQARVERFQNDPACKLFLVSLKAGGLGLNLTAAEYVFLLDPWWNPAVEAQAIDRAHRIGQTKPVFAYRLIARDTVEEKVLELQKSKRNLADAIIGEDNALIRNLKREDLELLLS